MDASSIPYKFEYTWGQNATAGFVTDPVPATSGGAAASQSLGFPPITSQPTGSGGIPPTVWDFNGVFSYLTSWTQWLQAGGPQVYDSSFQTNIGGYPNGAIVQSATLTAKLWLSTADNNVTNPDTGGGGWAQFPVVGYAAFTASGSWTPPAGVFSAFGRVWAAGGGGGGAQSTGAGGGGGPGELRVGRFA